MNREAVQHERGPRNSTIRRQVAQYLKESAASLSSPTALLAHPPPPITASRLPNPLAHLPRPQPLLPHQQPAPPPLPWASLLGSASSFAPLYHPSFATLNPFLFFSLPELSRSLLRSHCPCLPFDAGLTPDAAAGAGHRREAGDSGALLLEKREEAR